jgi:enoyl-CoA hydratase
MATGRGKIGVTELLVGVPFPPIALEMMRGSLGPRVAEDLVLTGRLCDADEALRLGIVHSLVPAEELAAQALDAANKLGAILPDTFALTKRQLRQPTVQRVDEQFRALGDRVRQEWRAPHVRARIRAFLDSTVRKK